MPVEPIYDHPVAVRMSAACYGALVRLAHYYWVTDCEPLPTRDMDLRMIARLETGLWQKHRMQIMQVVTDSFPAIRHAFEFREKRIDHLKHLSEKGRAARKLARLHNYSEAAHSHNRVIQPQKLRHERKVEPVEPETPGRKRMMRD